MNQQNPSEYRTVRQKLLQTQEFFSIRKLQQKTAFLTVKSIDFSVTSRPTSSQNQAVHTFDQ